MDRKSEHSSTVAQPEVLFPGWHDKVWSRCGGTHNTFLELGDGKKVLSRGRAVDVPIVTAGYVVKMNLTVSRLLHGVDVVLGIT